MSCIKTFCFIAEEINKTVSRTYIMNKKAIMGIGVLIIFIASILVAAIGAFVILTTQNRLQSEALKTGKDVREAVGTSVLLEKISAKNVSSNVMRDMEIVIRLGPSSSPIRFNKTSIIIISNNFSMTYTYGGMGEEKAFANRAVRTIDREINSTPVRLKTDLDNDDKEDYVFVYNSTTLRFNMSGDGYIDVTIPDISTPGTIISFSNDISSTKNYGSMSISGTTITPDEIDANMDFKIMPSIIDKGAYSIKYIMRGKTLIDDVLLYGDLVKMYIELSSSIGEEKPVTINVLTPSAVSLTKNIYTPNVMVDETIILFP